MTAATLLSGCRKAEEEFSIVPLEGTIESIRPASDGAGEITVVYTDRHGREGRGTGRVTPETDIMINGAAGKLKYLRVGERVRGEVRIRRRGQDRDPIALRIHVERAAPIGDP
jgi:hypothetical protein